MILKKILGYLKCPHFLSVTDTEPVTIYKKMNERTYHSGQKTLRDGNQIVSNDPEGLLSADSYLFLSKLLFQNIYLLTVTATKDCG